MYCNSNTLIQVKLLYCINCNFLIGMFPKSMQIIFLDHYVHFVFKKHKKFNIYAVMHRVLARGTFLNSHDLQSDAIFGVNNC